MWPLVILAAVVLMGGGKSAPPPQQTIAPPPQPKDPTGQVVADVVTDVVDLFTAYLNSQNKK